MAIPILGEIERLINEHGSAAIMKERLGLAADQYAVLERKLAAETERANKAEAASEALRRDVSDLQEQLAVLRAAHAAPTVPDQLDEVREKILVALSEHDRPLTSANIAYLLGVGEQAAKFHIEEMADQHLITNILRMDGPAVYLLDQEGRRYLIARGRLK